MSGKQSFKFRWESAISRTCYVASVKQVARVLAHYANADGTNARPGYERIMTETSLKKRTVLDALVVLIEDGWTEKASRVGVRRAYFDNHTLLMPHWLNDLSPGRPDCRREHVRAVNAEKMRQAREAAKSVSDQVHTYALNVEAGSMIELVSASGRSGAYAEPDQVHTTARSGAYARENVAGQGAPLPTSRPTLYTNHGAPAVAGALAAPLAAEPLVPDGVEFATAHSGGDEMATAEPTRPTAAACKPRPTEPFRNESRAYVAAAKKLDWDAVKGAIGKWKAARGGEYDWARKIALSRMGSAAKHGLKTPRGFERADRLTIEAALRMHLDDGNWHEALLAPLGVPEFPLAPLAINDLGDVRRRADLKTHFETLRQMDFDAVRELGLRFKDEEPELFAAAIKAALADIAIRADLSGDADRINRLACMQILNTTKDWPGWMTKALDAA